MMTRLPNKGFWLTHNIALTYLALTHGLDHEFLLPERESVARRLSSWLPDLDQEMICRAVAEAHRTYEGGFSTRQLWGIVVSLRGSLSRDTLARLLSDLSALSDAGALAMGGKDTGLIIRIASAWGLNAPAARLRSRAVHVDAECEHRTLRESTATL